MVTSTIRLPVPFKVKIPRFQDALANSHELGELLGRMTKWRLIEGQIPESILPFLLDPDVLDALADGARELTDKQRRDIRLEVERRRRNAEKKGRKPRTKAS